MAGKPRNIRQMVNYIKRVKNVYLAAHADTLVRITTDAQKRTIQNAKKQFPGRGGRKLSGNLFRGIKSGFEGDFRTTKNIRKLPRGFIIASAPYSAIHEFGGGIDPVKAKNLWIRVMHKGKFKRMSPTEFFDAQKRERLRGKARKSLASRGLNTDKRAKGGKRGVRKSQRDESFAILPSKKSGVTGVAAHMVRQRRGFKITPLFVLKKHVDIPARPYVAPAIRSALRFYSAKYTRSLAGLVASRFNK